MFYKLKVIFIKLGIVLCPLDEHGHIWGVSVSGDLTLTVLCQKLSKDCRMSCPEMQRDCHLLWKDYL